MLIQFLTFGVVACINLRALSFLAVVEQQQKNVAVISLFWVAF